jgi:hypothetical protein
MDPPDSDSIEDNPWKKIVSSAVHEIRTPLSSPYTSIEILKMNRLDPEKAHQLLLLMNRQIDFIPVHLDALVNEPASFLDTSPLNAP